MTPETYKEASRLFDQLRELPDKERAAALDAACGENAELLAQVLRLLEADRDASGGLFLKRHAIEDAAQLVPSAQKLLAPGTVIGNYRLGPRIASGGMGVVYEGQDLHLDRRVAIKVLPLPFAAEGAERVKRFQREARAASLLNHPNILSIFDADFDQGHYYIATEFVEGKTLRQLIAEEPKVLESKTILNLVAQTASALSVAHEAGIVHRDIKPENIMVRPDGLVKVLDFGLAKLREPSSNAANQTSDLLTRPGNLAGTIQYLSPEQVAGKHVDARSDLFSLGVVAYELATGLRPFDGPTDGAVYDAILNLTPGLPSSVRPALGVELDSLIARALEKDPELRFQTASDLRSACKRLSRDTSRSASLPAPLVTRRRRIGLKASAGVGLACICAALLWYFSSHSKARSQLPLPVQFQRLTDTPGEENFPSLSPDGKQFVYASAKQGNWDIYLQRTGGSAVINLTRDCQEDDTQPALSRDGSRIVFRSERDGGGLFVMESTGENPRRITRRGYLPAWAPDDSHVVYSSDTFIFPNARGAPVSRLFIVDISDGSERKLETGDAIQPNWSPHEHRIAYWGVSAGGRRDVFTVAASGNEQPVPVTNDAATDWNPVWSPTGRELYFLSDRGGTMNIWRVPIDEKSGRTLGPPAPVTVPAQYVGSLGLGGDGKALVYSQTSQRINLAWISFDPLRRISAGTPQPVGGDQSVSDISFSPDGSRLVFDTVGDASEHLWIMNTDGSGRRRLTSDTYRNRGPAWSPHGEEIVFFSDRAGQYDEWLIQADGSGLRPLTTNSYMQKAVWSPDGSRILASRSPGPPVILDPHAAQPVSSPMPAPGLAGEVLFNAWTAGIENGLAIGDALDGTPEIVVYSPSDGRLEHTGAVGRFGFWLRGGATSDPLNRYFIFGRGGDCLLYDRTLKRETRLFSVTPNRVYSLTIAPDGHRIYFTQAIRDADLWLARLE